VTAVTFLPAATGTIDLTSPAHDAVGCRLTRTGPRVRFCLICRRLSRILDRRFQSSMAGTVGHTAPASTRQGLLGHLILREGSCASVSAFISRGLKSTISCSMEVALPRPTEAMI
jgi:hypothetical protein